MCLFVLLLSLHSVCFFSLRAVVAVQAESAVRSRWSLLLRHHGPDRSSEEAVQRSCWRVKHPMSPGETGSEREPSPGDRVSPRTKQSLSAAESGNLVRNTVLDNTRQTGKQYVKHETLLIGAILIFVMYKFFCCCFFKPSFIYVSKVFSY